MGKGGSDRLEEKLSIEELKAITENLKWFSRFSPSKKIRIIERHKKETQYLLSLKVRKD